MVGAKEGGETQTALTQKPDLQPRGNLTLLVIGTGPVQSHRLPTHGEVTIGRGSRNTIALDDPSVSREHALLRVGADVELIDLGSRHGTQLRGQRVAANEPIRVQLGDAIAVGASLLVVQQAFAGGKPQPMRARTSPETTGARAATVLTPTLERMQPLLERVAPSTINVLILGETGVGKEILAERIHALSPRADKPLLRVNCTTLTESLLESELFGHEKGAFTGAQRAKPGLLENADGGTVFFDEVGELPLSFQVKLLRVLEDREVTRVGGLKPRAIDVRFVAATNRDLETEVTRGAFRSDLYFRLNGIALVLPALRDRVDEIPALARAFIDHFARQAQRPPPQLSPEALQALTNYTWPGNVRELRNVVQRAVLLCGDAIEPEQITTSTLAATAPAKPSDAPEDEPSAEEQRIRDALEQCAGNQTRAARMLGMSRRTLGVKLDRYGIPRPRRRTKGD